jgi:hypothetical protein
VSPHRIRAAARITELEDRVARALVEIEAVIAEMAESELALSGRPSARPCAPGRLALRTVVQTRKYWTLWNRTSVA